MLLRLTSLLKGGWKDIVSSNNKHQVIIEGIPNIEIFSKIKNKRSCWIRKEHLKYEKWIFKKTDSYEEKCFHGKKGIKKRFSEKESPVKIKILKKWPKRIKTFS